MNLTIYFMVLFYCVGSNAFADTLPGFTYKGVNIQLGGFLASEIAYRNNNLQSDIGTPFSKIPFPNSVAFNTPEFRGTERQSRFSLLAQNDPASEIHFSGYYELDFLGTSPTANPNESNSFTPRTRNVYMAVDWASGLHLLAGQNWSLATLNSGGITPRKEFIPPTIDAQYAVGFDWARQWQIRVTKNWGEMFWAALSVEGAQTVGVTGTLASGTGNTYQLTGGSLFNPVPMSINSVPDFIAKVAAETSVGHFEIFDLARNFVSKFGGTTIATQTNNQSYWTNAVGVGALVPVFPKTLDLALSGIYGQGTGRYGTSGLPDATYAADGSLQALTGLNYLAEGVWHASHELDVYATYGQETVYGAAGSTYGYGDAVNVTNAGCNTLGGTCSPQVKSLSQVGAGTWWSFYEGSYGVAKLGLQYSHTMLNTFADQNGFAPTSTEDMAFASLRFYPF